MVRGLDTTVRKIRRIVFTEVAKLGFKANTDTLNDDMEAIPFMIVDEDEMKYRESVYRARAVVSERLRLAMGLSLRPENKHVHLTAGLEASNISDKYYEPPLFLQHAKDAKRKAMKSATPVKDVLRIRVWRSALRMLFLW